MIGWGTAGAALVSQLNLDLGMKSYFSGSGDELYYGEVRCEYFAYQDDIGKPFAGVKEAQDANIKLHPMFQEKGLYAHPDKTGFIAQPTVFWLLSSQEELVRQMPWANIAYRWGKG